MLKKTLILTLTICAVVLLATSQPAHAQISELKLLPSDGAASDVFGNSVSISGDYAVVGARGDDDNGTDAGSAYVYNVFTSSSVLAKSILNINNITSWVERNGFFPWAYPGGWNGSHPKGTVGVIFTEGIVWGAKVSGDGDPITPRVNGSTYSNGLSAGKILGWSIDPDGSNYVPPTGADVHDDQEIRRVRRDYATADLTSDAASFIQIPIGDVTDADVQKIFDKYDHDWNNWPAADGAPYEDVNGNGSYNPAEDIPGIPGAAQTIWLVANDLDPDIAPLSYGSPPIGFEMQMTLWAYESALTTPSNNTIYKKVRLIYTGKIGGLSTAHIDTMYITQWSDPDLGTHSDDFVGWDADLKMGFVYNSSAVDAKYADFGLTPPAAGYTLLSGPTSNGNELTISSFLFFGADSEMGDPDLGVYEGTLQWFNLMEGFLPRPSYPTQEPFIDPTTGSATKFALWGDPVAGTGWIDGNPLASGDRRLLMTAGPFSMALGDTQEVMFALTGATGTDYLNSVTELKQSVQQIRDDFLTGIEFEESDELPQSFSLRQNYPNPFNPETVIEYALPEASRVSLVIYNLLGQEVRRWDIQGQTAGFHQVNWNASSLASGVYLYRLQAGDFVQTRKMVLLK